MLFLLSLFLLLILLGWLAEKLSLPVWAWGLLIATAISLSMMISGWHWLGVLFAIAPAIAFSFPQFRFKYIALPWLEKVSYYIDINSKLVPHNINAKKNAWLSDLVLAKHNQFSQLNDEATSSLDDIKDQVNHISAKELKLIYQYYHLLRGQAADKKSLSESISKGKKFAALGIEEAYGGVGLSVNARALLILKIAAVNRELARILADMNCTLQSLIAQHGSAKQKGTLLPAIASGKLICSGIPPNHSSMWQLFAVHNKQAIKQNRIEIRIPTEVLALIQEKYSIGVDLITMHLPLYNKDSLDEVTYCWALIDCEQLNQLNASTSKAEQRVTLPDESIITAGSDRSAESLLNTYYSEKAVYNLAINSADSLNKALLLSSKTAVALAIAARDSSGSGVMSGNLSSNLSKQLITNNASQWRDAWLLKQTRYQHLEMYDNEQAGLLINQIFAADNTSVSQEAFTSNPVYYLMQVNPYWNKLINTKRLKEDKQSDEKQLLAFDDWLGNYISNLLRGLYWSMTRDIFSLVATKITNIARENTTDSTKIDLLGKNLKHMEIMFAIAVENATITQITSEYDIDLMPALKNLLLLRAVYHGLAGDNTPMSSFPPSSFCNTNRYIWTDISHKTKLQISCAMASLPYKSSLAITMSKFITQAILALSWGYKQPNQRYDWHLSQSCSIPSKERQDFFQELEYDKTAEELVKISWLVREIYDSWQASSPSMTKPPTMTYRQWYDELTAASMISPQDAEILNDFDNKVSDIDHIL